MLTQTAALYFIRSTRQKNDQAPNPQPFMSFAGLAASGRAVNSGAVLFIFAKPHSKPSQVCGIIRTNYALCSGANEMSLDRVRPSPGAVFVSLFTKRVSCKYGQ